MNSKLLWIICGSLFVVFTSLLAISSGGIRGTFIQKLPEIAGSSWKASEPVNYAFSKPPEKSSGATDPQIYAKAVILRDVGSSYVMYEKNAAEKVPIASTTKIMTAMVVLEDYSDRLNDVVTITYPMIAVEGSDIKLTPGEKIKVDNLLKGLLIMSGNDTAYSLATYFDGKEAFVAKMNQKARELGLENTDFKDPAGLDDDGYSNAHDLAVLASYAMRHDKFREIVKTPETSISSVDGSIIHDLKSSNHMLNNDDNFYYPLAIGIKTGFTYAAGHCLVSAAANNNHEILAVVLYTNENSITASAAESRKLLEWGFSNWTWQ